MPSSPIHLAHAADFVTLEVLEWGTAQSQSEGDLRLRVAVSSDGFAGAYDQVWVARDDWAAFLAALARLERERAGRASLVSVSPGEFKLHLEIIDRAGHLTAHGRLAHYHFNHPSGAATRSRIEYAVPVDPSLLRQLLRDFEALRRPES